MIFVLKFVENFLRDTPILGIQFLLRGSSIFNMEGERETLLLRSVKWLTRSSLCKVTCALLAHVLEKFDELFLAPIRVDFFV
jgi:hypothetical protein